MSHLDSSPRTRSYTNERRFLDISTTIPARSRQAWQPSNATPSADRGRGGGSSRWWHSHALESLLARSLRGVIFLSPSGLICLSAEQHLNWTMSCNLLSGAIWCHRPTMERPFANSKLGVPSILCRLSSLRYQDMYEISHFWMPSPDPFCCCSHLDFAPGLADHP